MATKPKKKDLPPDIRAQFEARFGTKLVTGEERQSQNVGMPVVRTGIPTLDYALAVGGVPRGLITEIFGNSQYGKTWLLGRLIAEAQKIGGNGGILDVEGTLNPGLMINAGADWSTMFAPAPETGSAAFRQADMLVSSGALDVLGIDSVPSLIPDEDDPSYEAGGMAEVARLMSSALPRLNRQIKGSNVAVVFINQLREKPGVSFGSPEYQPGGRALPYYAGLRMSLRKSKDSSRSNFKDDEGLKIGHRLRVVIEKSKVAAPHAEAEFQVFFRDGFAQGVGEVQAGLDLGDAYLTLLLKLGAANIGGGNWVTIANPETGEEIAKKAGRRKAGEYLVDEGVGAQLLDPIVYKSAA